MWIPSGYSDRVVDTLAQLDKSRLTCLKTHATHHAERNILGKTSFSFSIDLIGAITVGLAPPGGEEPFDDMTTYFNIK